MTFCSLPLASTRPYPAIYEPTPSSCHAHKLACPRPFTLFIRFPPIPFVSRLLACLFCYFFPRRVRGGNSSLDISIADAVENRIKGFFFLFSFSVKWTLLWGNPISFLGFGDQIFGCGRRRWEEDRGVGKVSETFKKHQARNKIYLWCGVRLCLLVLSIHHPPTHRYVCGSERKQGAKLHYSSLMLQGS